MAYSPDHRVNTGQVDVTYVLATAGVTYVKLDAGVHYAHVQTNIFLDYNTKNRKFLDDFSLLDATLLSVTKGIPETVTLTETIRFTNVFYRDFQEELGVSDGEIAVDPLSSALNGGGLNSITLNGPAYVDPGSADMSIHLSTSKDDSVSFTDDAVAGYAYDTTYANAAVLTDVATVMFRSGSVLNGSGLNSVPLN